MKNRHLESLSPIIKTEIHNEGPLILCSPSDIGVRLNLGRNGTRFAPEAILNSLKKMQNHLPYKDISLLNVSNQKEEELDFEKAQSKETDRIKAALEKNNSHRLIHLGGGHDHIFPLLSALPFKDRQIIIINFDAHCDTRIDDKNHSGTPFRNFDQLKPLNTSLIQVGIHRYANSKSTMKDLNHINQTYIYKDEFTDTELLTQVLNSFEKEDILKDAIIVISLDADGLLAQEMEAVSAPNHNGFSQTLVRKFMKHLSAQFNDHQIIFGIYEYNPIFDNLSQKGCRLITGLIYDFLDDSVGA